MSTSIAERGAMLPFAVSRRQDGAPVSVLTRFGPPRKMLAERAS
jgi:hypothetical protein